ncbi:MAG TPA: fused MFS/spermidine synthase, partial [Tahibacter sp.]|nr:fused MFS/spermidine synthase [Tahibacter sp.]
FTLALLRGGGGEPAIGRIYAANTVGAIVGVFLAVHLLIPVFGLKLAMIGAAAADLALGVVLLRRDSAARGEGSGFYLGSVVTCGLAVALTLVFARFDPLVMTSGVYRTGAARRDAAEWHVDYYRDGKTASIGVIDHLTTGTRNIVTNGKPDAAIATKGEPTLDEMTMVMLGTLPVLLNPDATEVANIGFGSGLSTHSVLGEPRIKRVDTIEIEPAMVEGARAFQPRNGRAYDDPRSFIHYDDAKSYFASHRSSYDAIISEPSNPWVAGVAALFSREFYQLMPRYLKPGGLLVQWIQLYEIDEELLGTIMNALGDTFPTYEVYQTGTGDMVVVASMSDAIRQIDALPEAGSVLGKELALLDLRVPADFSLRKLGDKKTLGPYYAALTYRRNSDFYPVISLEAPRARFRGVSASYTDSLPIQDIALLEVLNGKERPLQGMTRSRNYTLPILVGNAEAIRDVIETGKYNDRIVESDDGASALVLRQTMVTCQTELPEPLVVAALSRVAGRTTPFLPRADAERLWSERAWVKCGHPGKAAGDMLELAGAEARRDWPRVNALAVGLLDQHRDKLQPFVADRVLRLACLAAIANGEYAQVSELLKRFAKTVAPYGHDGLHRRLHLEAYANARLAARERPAQ